MFVARHGTAVTTSDTTAVRFKGLYIGGAGDVTVQCVGDAGTVTFKAVPVGTFLPVTVIKVMATGTTATQIVGLS